MKEDREGKSFYSQLSGCVVVVNTWLYDKNISKKNLNLLAKKLVYMIMIFQAINKFHTPKAITLKVQAKYRVLSTSNLFKPPKCASCYENKFSILAQPYAHGNNLRYGETNFIIFKM